MPNLLKKEPKKLKKEERKLSLIHIYLVFREKLLHHCCCFLLVNVCRAALENKMCIRDRSVGAQVLPTIEDVYATADMIVQVKEPIAPEYHLIRKGQLLFTYFHFASDKELTLAMIDNKSICLAYETVEKEDHSLPLLIRCV